MGLSVNPPTGTMISKYLKLAGLRQMWLRFSEFEEKAQGQSARKKK